MTNYHSDTARAIRTVYGELTSVERSIADFFLDNSELIDFSSKNIAGKLYVSEASLSRFAKKCGYKGFREFIYNYECEFKRQQTINIDDLSQKVISTYHNILDQSAPLLNGQQMNRIAVMLSGCKHVYTYGIGGSGIAAREFKLRFMRIGIAVESVTDSHLMHMTSALLNQDSLVIAFSVSGTTPSLLSGLSVARDCGAKIVLITANQSSELTELCDEVLVTASLDRLQAGLEISPQFPILVVVDVFFNYYLNTSYYEQPAMRNEALAALYKGYTGR